MVCTKRVRLLVGVPDGARRSGLREKPAADCLTSHRLCFPFLRKSIRTPSTQDAQSMSYFFVADFSSEIRCITAFRSDHTSRRV